MAEFYRQLQAALYLAASTVDIWRDAGIALCAGVAIVSLWVFAESLR